MLGSPEVGGPGSSIPIARRYRAGILGSLALAGGYALGASSTAFAQCAITGFGTGGTNSVTCSAPTATSDTANFDAAAASSNQRRQNFTQSGGVTGSVYAAVTGYGLWIINDQSGAAGNIIFNNLGSVMLTSGAAPAGGRAPAFDPAVLNLSAGPNGNLTYAGNGIISQGNVAVIGAQLFTTGTGTINFGSSGAPIVPTITGTTGLLLNGGTQNVFISGGSITVTSNSSGFGLSLDATSGSGAIYASLIGNTAITQTGGAGVTSGIGAGTLSRNNA